MDDLPFTIDLAISINDDAWRKNVSDIDSLTTEAIQTTLGAVSKEFNLAPLADAQKPAVEISLVFTDDAEVQILNRDHRNKDAPTNVLSFPNTPLDQTELADAMWMKEPLMLGDVVMARETLIREAAEQNKSIRDHLTHLLVHGVLHLAGFDHMEENEAEKMENLEIMILQSLHISSPYELSEQPRQETPDQK
ncbi:rRNA maturation RNase YbeY [Sneathiella sp.]|uniref:rRNA maturation RNase YbeY n=1 Tax=Sneathiella sp. TaxID=1964365 RepID=UPI002621E7DB|nr:rRNA maturation RNase YbeY [Sneathiella sp.]MDF2366993.1 rRNA maturation RNase YbeY [Sneathiella sp.]